MSDQVYGLTEVRGLGPSVPDDVEKLRLLLNDQDFEGAESLAYSIYRRLKNCNR